MKRSIRFRLLGWILLFVVPLSIGGGWLLSAVFADRMLRDVDIALHEEGDTISSLMGRNPDPAILTPFLDRIAAEHDLGSNKQVAVLRGGALIGESPNGAHERLTRGASDLRIARVQGSSAEEPLTILIGVHASPTLKAGQRLTILLAVGIPLLLVSMTVGLWIVIGRALWPLEEASRQVDRITGDNLAARVRVSSTGDEVGRMVAVLNAMLARLEISVLDLQRFTADAAHELRTPLAVLRTGLEVGLSRERSAAEYRTALEEALVGTERLSRLADDLLTLARLDARVAPPSPLPLSLGEMLNELVDGWIPVAQQRNVAIAATTPINLQVKGDEGDLYRLFSNLIANAVAHSPSGGRVAIEAERDGARVRVRVSDDGPGLAAGEEERIFDRFYRGNGAPTGGGSGLGLSIARTIALAHGGELAIRNGAAGGCVAMISLPSA